MKYIINVENPTPDLLRQLWVAASQQQKPNPKLVIAPTSTDGGAMKIFVQIVDAEPDLIVGIGKVVTLIGHPKVENLAVQPKPGRTRTHKWSRLAKINLKKKSATAPWGLKKDGTPRKPRKPRAKTTQQLPLKG